MTPKDEIKKDSLLVKPLEIMNLMQRKKNEEFKKYAGLNRRMMATTIDAILASIVIAPVVDYILGFYLHSREITLEELNAARSNENTEIEGLLRLLMDSGKLSELVIGYSFQLLALLVASGICWKIWSSTPGKMLLRMKIVDADSGKSLTNKQIIVRSIGYIPSCAFLFIGIFWIAFNKRCKGWHDIMANTVVIKVDKKKQESTKDNT